MSGPRNSYDPKQVRMLAPDVLDEAVSTALAAFAAATDLDELAAARPAHLGDRSPVLLARRELGALPPQARADAGRRVNAARATVQAGYDDRLAGLTIERDQRVLREESVDVTLPWDTEPRGARHPLTTIAERVTDVFVAMGYELAEGPEAEAEWLNFDALNFPPGHPTRTMHDTLWLAPPERGRLLRTQTSSVQIRALLTRNLPVYVISPGRVYRDDPIDATHSPVFTQVEGLAVDEGLTIAHLKGTLDRFVEGMFGAGLTSRLRPSYFPFTEPSAELDFECFACHGESTRGGSPCRTCGSEGWIEWGGCGMVNPRVLAACGIEAERYTGFAFGMGLERALMFRNGVTDMRDIYEGDVRFTLPFGMEA